MATHETLLLLMLVVGLGFAIFLLWRIRSEMEDGGGVETDQLTSALALTFEELGFNTKVTQIQRHAESMEELHTDIERMLQSPRERGEFGEQQLDVLLDDHLPPDMYGIREQVVDGKTPDAHIRSPEGTICIDSKFPLDNYEKYAKADDEDEKKEYRRQFGSDVERQLRKIESDYVRPEEGTTNFAFAFIPSEGVYYHLVTEEYDMLRRYTREGVQVVSPLTLGHKLELIKAGVTARKLSEEARVIAERLESVGAGFDDLEDEWTTLRRHVRNAYNKADDVDGEYQRLRSEFDRVEGMSSAESDGLDG